MIVTDLVCNGFVSLSHSLLIGKEFKLDYANQKIRSMSTEELTLLNILCIRSLKSSSSIGTRKKGTT